MRKNILIITFLLIAVAGLTIWLDSRISIGQPQQGEEKHVYSQAAPEFSFTTLQGETLSLNDLRGKIVILHFWATWCPPCIAEFPKLITAVESFNTDIALVALSSDSEEKDIKEFLKSHSLNMNSPDIYIAIDKDRAITQDVFQTFAYPETIIIDRQGKMVRKIAGDADWTSPEMTAYLRSISKF